MRTVRAPRRSLREPSPPRASGPKPDVCDSYVGWRIGWRPVRPSHAIVGTRPTDPPCRPRPPQVQLLRHQCSFLHGDLARYFNRPTFSDLSIVSPDGRKIFCHQAVLCAASPRLAQTLEPGTLTGEELPVWGVDSDALHAVLRFFYTGEATLTFATAAPLCDAAQRLEVTSLAQHCQAFLADVLHPSTVVAIYRQAVTLRMDELQAQVRGRKGAADNAAAATGCSGGGYRLGGLGRGAGRARLIPRSVLSALFWKPFSPHLL